MSVNLKESTIGTDLSINGIAMYQPFDGLAEMKVVRYILIRHYT